MAENKNLKNVILWLISQEIVESQEVLAERLGYNPSSLSQIVSGIKPLSDKFIKKLIAFCDKINPNYFSGEGSMLKNGSGVQLYDPKNALHSKKLIPFFDDVASIGGTNERIANVDSVSYPEEYIDAGDWFRDATAAIRHYGESMIEYPEGCILALKEVVEKQLVIWGRDYVIETSEYRITKRVQKGKDSDHITAYSTNPEIYPDGRLVHEPQDIAWKDIRRISLVLGYVVKKNGGTIVFNNSKNQ